MSKRIGSITNGTKKLEIQIIKFENHEFHIGHKVQIVGKLCTRNYTYHESSPYLQVQSMKSIKKLKSTKMNFQSILDGYHYVI